MAEKYISRDEMIAALRKMMEIIIETSGDVANSDPRDIPNCLFRYYIESGDKRLKPFYNVVADSFLSLKAFCLLMGGGCWTQASGVLRTALEQVSASVVLLKEASARERYIKLHEEHCEFCGLSSEEQKAFLKDRKIQGRGEKSYFDYSWINPNDYGRNQILRAAHLEEFIADIEETLNGFSHGSISIFQFSGKDGDWKLMGRHGRRTTLACCKLYDFLVCATAAFVGDEFNNWKISESFPTFKKTYLSVCEAKVVD